MQKPETLREARASDLRSERLQKLRNAIMQRHAAQLKIEYLVPRLHASGMSWRELGSILGVSGQAAQKRYGRPA